MRKIITIFISMFLFSVLYAATWSYYLIDLGKITPEQKIELIGELDKITNGRASNLNYYIYNTTEVVKQTRMIFDCWDTIESKNIYTVLSDAGAIEKFRTRICVATECENIITMCDTIIFDHLTSVTSWYLIDGVE